MAYSARSWDANASNLDCACFRPIPGFKSPIAPGKIRRLRSGFGKGSALNPHVTHISTSVETVLPGWRNPGGRTPTMV